MQKIQKITKVYVVKKTIGMHITITISEQILTTIFKIFFLLKIAQSQTTTIKM